MDSHDRLSHCDRQRRLSHYRLNRLARRLKTAGGRTDASPSAGIASLSRQDEETYPWNMI
jgi:hypothetical protein